MRTNAFNDWGWNSAICRLGAAGAAFAAGARLVQEATSIDIKFMPLLDSVPAWLVADVTVIVASIVGGVVSQIAFGLITLLRQEL